ncbi:MAG: helix-turn-helix domain-containing protein, partial [Actinobacteria bacterium]|nr:helix-turn-helix domain-containing protein [Actinomycetota bacterium]
MDTTPGAPAIGERIRLLRKGRMTQTDLAAAADVSPDVIRKLEQGQRNSASIASLHRIARALDVDLGDLFGRRAIPEATPHAGVVALRQAVANVDDLLGTVEGEPLSLRDAERSVTYLWGTYWSGRYDALTGLIPQALTGLRCTLHAADPAERPRATEYLAQGYEVAGSTLTHLHQLDAAFIAIRRAVDLAGESDDPLLAAILKGSVAWQLMVGGRFDEAERVATRTAEDIEPGGEVEVAQLSAYGSLLVSAATAAGRANRSPEAYELLGESGAVARRLGADRTDYQRPFGPSQVTMQTVDVGVVTEDYPAALDA